MVNTSLPGRGPTTHMHDKVAGRIIEARSHKVNAQWLINASLSGLEES